MPLFFTSTTAKGYNPYEFYLGPKAADPTVDNNGGALVEGQYYWNTALNIVRFYTGTVWADSNLTAVQKTGDIMTGQLTLPGGGTGNQAATVTQVDAKVSKAGDTMTGPLVLSGNATANLQAVPLQQLEAVVAWKNKLINANALIGQLNYVSGTATSIANQFTIDRWRVITLGQNLSWTTTGGIRTFTAPAGGVEQVIESLSLPAGTYCVSWIGTATATINGSGIANGGTFVANGVTNYTLRFIGGTFSLPQVEPGTRRTAFEHRPDSVETMLAWRYRRAVGAGTVGRWYTTTDCALGVVFNPPMRVAPAALAIGITASVANIGVGNLSTASPTITSLITPTGGYVLIGGFSGATVGGTAIGNNDFILLDAEL
jgi:hypothetical protein